MCQVFSRLVSQWCALEVGDCLLHAGRSRLTMHFLIVIYTACRSKSLAKWWWLFIGTSHCDLEGWEFFKMAAVGFPMLVATHVFLILSLVLSRGVPEYGTTDFDQWRCSRMTSRAIMNMHYAHIRALVEHHIRRNGPWL